MISVPDRPGLVEMGGQNGEGNIPEFEGGHFSN